MSNGILCSSAAGGKENSMYFDATEFAARLSTLRKAHVARLKVLKADHQSQQYRMEDKLLKYFPAEIEKQAGYIHGFEADIKTVEAHPQISEGFCGMEIMGKHYAEKADVGEIILAACKETKSADPVPLGSYRGFQMELSYAEYRQVKKEMQEYLIAKQTVEHILGIDRHKRVEEKKQQKEEQR